ncbi:MAG: AAA family ATPase [Erythrobacter sp.]
MAEEKTQRWQRIPVEMRERPQWCLVGENKRPLMKDGRNASPTDPATWTDFPSAVQVANERGRGIGYVLTADDPFSCIDIDVKDDTSPDDIGRYQSIIEQCGSYTEKSRSGRGYHIWVRGKIGTGRRRDGVEVYSQARFIICTGDVVRDLPIEDRQTLLTNMVKQMTPKTHCEVELWGDDVADWAAAAQAADDAGELGRLFCGDWAGRYPSQSEADLALVKLLLPLTLSPKECWNTFLLSKLGQRDKANRPDYARRTMALAMQHRSNDAAAIQHGEMLAQQLLSASALPQSASVPPNGNTPRLFRLLFDEDLQQRPPLRWLVKGVMPQVGIGAIFGQSGTFKSFLTLDLLAHISNGRDWFGHRVKAAPAVYVPFEGQGGIPNRVKAWRLAQAAQRNPEALFSVVPPDDIRSNIAVIMDPINLRDPADRECLVATLVGNGWAGGVLCIDTLAHASAGIDENSSAMGEMITIFQELQTRLGGVILLIHHSGKNASRGMRGWSGLHAAMDFVIECERPEDSAELVAEFVLTKVKDDTNGIRTRFRLLPVQIGIDEDGDYVSSLVVAPADEAGASSNDNPFKTIADEAAEANDDDAFVGEWIRREVKAGKKPTGRWLEAQRTHIMGQRSLTQKRLRAAIDRLKGTERLVETPGGPSNAKWLRPCDVPTDSSG